MLLPATIQRKDLATQMTLGKLATHDVLKTTHLTKTMPIFTFCWLVFSLLLLEFPPPSELVCFLLLHINSTETGHRALTPMRPKLGVHSSNGVQSTGCWTRSKSTGCLVSPRGMSPRPHMSVMWRYGRFIRHVMLQQPHRVCRYGLPGMSLQLVPRTNSLNN